MLSSFVPLHPLCPPRSSRPGPDPVAERNSATNVSVRDGRNASNWTFDLGERSAEITWQVLDAIDEARQQAVGLAYRSYVRHPEQQFAQHNPDLAPGQVGAEAEMRASAAKSYVRVGGAGDVKPQRVVEDGLIPVG